MNTILEMVIGYISLGVGATGAWIIILGFSLFLLVKSADYFTQGAENIGTYLGMSSFIVGATIVSVGGSMPELATSLLGVMDGNTGFPIDNVIGSNIANSLLIGGIVAIVVGTLKVNEKLVDVDLPFFFISSALFILFIMDGVFTWKEGVISLALLVIFIVYTLSDTGESEGKTQKTPKKFNVQWIVAIGIGMIGIFIGAKYTIQSVEKIGALLDIPSAIITMLGVGIGTSLPELIISVRAALAGKHSVALGNVFGSNIFNVLAVVAVPSFIVDLKVSETALQIGIPMFIISTLAFLFTTSDNQIRKWEGMALLILYIAFLGKLTGIL